MKEVSSVSIISDTHGHIDSHIIDYLKKQTKKCDNKFTTFVKYRAEELMALYAEVKRLKNENEILETNLYKLKKLHNEKVLEKREKNL